MMPTTCTRCENTGFLNIQQVDNETLERFDKTGNPDEIFHWMDKNPSSDVQVCDCCGNGETWYGERGWHYNSEDPPGQNGPYAYNGGLCECN